VSESRLEHSPIPVFRRRAIPSTIAGAIPGFNFRLAQRRSRKIQREHGFRRPRGLEVPPNPSIERTSTSGLRPLAAAAHVKR
jgi:hypothetical protein